MNLPIGNQVKIIGSEDRTECTLFKREESSGNVTKQSFSVDQGQKFTTDVVSGNTYRIECTKRIFVAQVGITQVTEEHVHLESNSCTKMSSFLLW